MFTNFTRKFNRDTPRTAKQRQPRKNNTKRLQLEHLEERKMFSVSGDFNGDGFADLAIAVSGETVNGHAGAGAVSIIYGSSNKLTTTGNQLWTLDSAGIIGTAHDYDEFGSALAIGDFNGDGYDDLAIGVAKYKIDGKAQAGAVNIIFGSANGLTKTGNKQYSENTSGINGVAGTDAYFGSIAAGDFNGDGRDDLAIGTKGERVDGLEAAGGVHVLYGSKNGLKTSGDQMWTYNSAGINGVAAEADYFGSSLTVGDFNHDGRDDLAAGAWGKYFNVQNEAGAATVIYGSASGLTSSGDQFWRQGHDGLSGSLGTVTHFGYTLAAGDFNGDGFDDLAMAAPNASANGMFRSGEVNVIYGSAQKLTTNQQQLFMTETLGLTSGTEFYFGTALTAADFDGDGRDELAVEIVGYDLDGATNAGLVAVIHNTSFGLTSVNPTLFTQNTANLADTAETGDCFGYFLTAGDYNGDGKADLVIASPFEDFNGFDNAGVLHVLYGSAAGPATAGSQFFTQDTIGILGASQLNDEFGGGMA